MGPAALRTAGLGPLLENLGYAVEDHGDIPALDLVRADDSPPSNTRQYREIGAWARAVSARAYALARSGALPVFLGGDHSLSMGSVNGVARHWHEQGRQLFVLWLDAPPAYKTPATPKSGPRHGRGAGFRAAG